LNRNGSRRSHNGTTQNNMQSEGKGCVAETIRERGYRKNMAGWYWGILKEEKGDKNRGVEIPKDRKKARRGKQLVGVRESQGRV